MVNWSSRVVVATAALLSAQAFAYWAPNHMEINQQVAEEGKPFNFKRGGHTIIKLDDYVKNVFMLTGLSRELKGVEFKRATNFFGGQGDQPSDDPSGSHTLLMWITKGGLWEDGFVDLTEGMEWGGYRAVNHFHNPIARTGDGGYNGFIPTSYTKTVPYLNLGRSGISAHLWAEGGSNGSETNFWGTNALRDSFTQYFLESEPEKREKGLANAFRAMGQLEHLIEDNTVPDHARDLPHPGDGFEEYLARYRKTVFGHLPQNTWRLLPVTAIEDTGLRGFWDQDGYTGNNPLSAGLSSKLGIAEITNANFFAWNDFVFFPIHYWFSTIPAEPRSEFVDNQLVLPWPTIGDKVGAAADPTYWNTTPQTLALSPAAYGKTTYFDGQTPVWILDANVWSKYAEPLMQLAHGYAQSFLSTAMPSVDAELLPDPADPLHKVVLRLWNLGGDSKLGNGVKWHLKSVQLKPIQPKKPIALPPGLTNATDAIAVTFSDVEIPAGEAGHDSEPFTLSYSQRTALLYASHLAVEIEAELGTAKPLPLHFGVMIPSAFASIEEQVATGLDSVEAVNSDCNVACSPSWSRGSGAQWLHQVVNGIVKPYATKNDPLGTRAPPVLQQVQQDIAHIAAVAVIASDEVYGIDRWRFPKGVKLTVTGSELKQPDANTPIWVRTNESDRSLAEPAQTTFAIDLQLNQAANPQLDKATGLIANNLYVAVFMTSGAMSFTKLALWSPPVSLSPSQVAGQNSCPSIVAGAVSNTSWNLCGWGGPANPDPTCEGTSAVTHGRAILMNSMWSGVTSTSPQAIAFFVQFPQLKPLTLQGQSVALTQSVPQGCPNDLFKRGAPPCLFGTGIIYVETSTGGGGVCPGPSAGPPLFVPNATVTRDDKTIQFILGAELGQMVPPIEIDLK